MKLTIHFDGGGQNPGLSACGAVAYGEAGDEVTARGVLIGEGTNNIAEYEGALLALRLAAEQGASEVELVGDSQLIIHQLEGEWRVKDPRLGELYRQAMSGLESFAAYSLRWVPREQNRRADALVREILAAESGQPEGKVRTSWKGIAEQLALGATEALETGRTNELAKALEAYREAFRTP